MPKFQVNFKIQVSITVGISKYRSIDKNPNPRLKHIKLHNFRHSIDRYLKNKGFSVKWIQNFLGHESYKMTVDMYGTLSSDEMQTETERRLREL